MSRETDVSKTLRPWLKANLGKTCLAGLTSVDSHALDAAVHLVSLYAYNMKPAVLEAFKLTVMQMQPYLRQLAYHAIAHIVNWDDRARYWADAGLPALEHVWVCNWEPGGRERRVVR